MMNVSTNLISQRLDSLKINNKQDTPILSPAAGCYDAKTASSNLLTNFLVNQSIINSAVVSRVSEVKAEPVKPYKNDLRTLFNTNSAKILAIIPRTFNAKDTNGNEYIERNETHGTFLNAIDRLDEIKSEGFNTLHVLIIPRTFNAKDTNGNEYIERNETHGTFLNAIDRLDEIKSEGFNTLHVLPINPPGANNAMGTAGSVYAPADILKLDPMLIDKNDPRSDKEQFKAFVDACHNRGIRVMVDLPSCASYDLYNAKPELMAHERNGLAKTPQGWFDIRMFQPWEDEGKRTLNPQLLEYHRKFVDMMIDAGVDGIRADVARAKPVEFWDIIIPYSRKRDPEFAWLAETYTYEDASPQANMPYDRPEDSLRSGFDAYYGQYHIFNEWNTAKELNDYVLDNLNMS